MRYLLCGVMLLASVPFAPAAFAVVQDEERVVDLWQLFQEAELQDPRVLAGRALLEGGKWRKREAFGQLLPQLSASSTLNRTAQENDMTRQAYNGERYALTLSQVIYDSQAWNNYRRYSELAVQQQAEFAVTQEEATLDLIERYFTALAAEDELALLSAELRATERSLARVDSLYKRQLATITDVLEISARVDSLKAGEIEARNAVEVGREALSEIVGREIVGRLKRVDQQAVFLPPEHDREYWVRQAISENPIIEARSRAVAAAQAAMQQASGGYRPKVSLSLSGQRSDIGYENSQAQITDTYVVSLGVQVPLYSGGSTRARVSASASDLIVAEQELEQAKRQVVRETRSAFYDAQAGVSKIAAARKAMKSSTKAREAAEHAFGYGVMNAVDVLNSIKEEYAARRAMLQSQYDFILSSLLLRRWSGSLVRNDVRTVNEWLLDALPLATTESGG
ncbi:TolC family outer membrane protein [Pseudomonas stutzeri]|nr:TolC family outer membrane protein [Stutzerimonas stutzeri]MBK3866907.1 TolC family outer membrane protein [Stutzerimonas stutzeri]